MGLVANCTVPCSITTIISAPHCFQLGASYAYVPCAMTGSEFSLPLPCFHRTNAQLSEYSLGRWCFLGFAVILLVTILLQLITQSVISCFTTNTFSRFSCPLLYKNLFHLYDVSPFPVNRTSASPRMSHRCLFNSCLNFFTMPIAYTVCTFHVPMITLT